MINICLDVGLVDRHCGMIGHFYNYSYRTRNSGNSYVESFHFKTFKAAWWLLLTLGQTSGEKYFKFFYCNKSFNLKISIWKLRRNWSVEDECILIPIIELYWKENQKNDKESLQSYRWFLQLQRWNYLQDVLNSQTHLNWCCNRVSQFHRYNPLVEQIWGCPHKVQVPPNNRFATQRNLIFNLT